MKSQYRTKGASSASWGCGWLWLVIGDWVRFSFLIVEDAYSIRGRGCSLCAAFGGKNIRNKEHEEYGGTPDQFGPAANNFEEQRRSLIPHLFLVFLVFLCVPDFSHQNFSFNA